MVYLPTFTNLPCKSTIHVGKDSNPMDPMGYMVNLFVASSSHGDGLPWHPWPCFVCCDLVLPIWWLKSGHLGVILEWRYHHLGRIVEWCMDWFHVSLSLSLLRYIYNLLFYMYYVYIYIYVLYSILYIYMYMGLGQKMLRRKLYIAENYVKLCPKLCCT